MPIQFQQQVQRFKYHQDNIHGWSCNQRAKIGTCNVSDMPRTLWNLPSNLPCRNSKGSEACHLHSRVQSNVGDVISSEISKLGRGICEQRRSGTGLGIVYGCKQVEFWKKWQASFPWQCWTRPGSPSIITECNYGLLHHCQGEGGLSSLDTMEGGNSDNVWASESGLHRSSTRLWKSILKPSYYIVQPALGQRPKLPHQVVSTSHTCCVLTLQFFSWILTVPSINEWLDTVGINIMHEKEDRVVPQNPKVMI